MISTINVPDALVQIIFSLYPKVEDIDGNLPTDEEHFGNLIVSRISDIVTSEATTQVAPPAGLDTLLAQVVAVP